MEEIGYYILPKWKTGIPSTCERNSTFLTLVLLHSTQEKTEFLILMEDIPDLQYGFV
jgi:hypothetical protein